MTRSTLLRHITLISITAALCLGSGCATRIQGSTHSLEGGDRVAVVVTNTTGHDNTGASVGTIQKPHLYEALIRIGLEPVAINDENLTGALASVVGGEQPKAEMRPHIEALDLDYVLVIGVHSLNIHDYKLDAVLVDMADMSVAGYAYHEDRELLASCLAFSWTFVYPCWVCPFFAIHDQQEREIDLVEDLLREFTGR